MKINRLLATLTCAALAAFTHPATAAPGDLDLTFGGSGVVFTDLTPFDDSGNSVAVQADGKIVIAGYGSFQGTFPNGGVHPLVAVVRLNSDGSLDTAFSGDGKIVGMFSGSDNYAVAVAIQPDQKIVIAAWANLGSGGTDDAYYRVVVRLNVDGSYDTSFANGGKLFSGNLTEVRAMGLQSDGKIVSVGRYASSALVRDTSSGSIDSSFGAGGRVVTADSGNYVSVAIQGDAKIVVIGQNLRRFNTDGSPDFSFNGNGMVMAGGNGLALQNDGKIIVAGNDLRRYNVNGSPDLSFNGTGIVTGGGGNALVLQNDGKIVVVAPPNLKRYNPDGSPDASFSGMGVVTGGNSMALQSDGKILTTGAANGAMVVARYEGAGLSTPISQTVTRGSSVTFSVVPLGIQPLGYQWRKDGVNIPGANSSSLTIVSAQPWDVGDYTVVATHSGGAATSGAALLQVTGIPTALWRGLVVYYPFDGDALDREAGHSHAVVSGASQTTDRFGVPNRAFDFDGINDKMTATVPNLPGSSTPRTLSVFAKARPDPARSVSLVEWGLAQNGRAFGIANSNSPYTWNGKTYGAGFGVNSGVVVDSKWHHLCLTYEGGILSIFLDGVLKQTKSEAINTGLSVLTMGVGVEGSTFFPGSLDEIRIYNRALSASEVLQLRDSEDPDTDGDGILDRFETGTGIYVSAEDTGSSPTNPDSDGDGLNDGQEVNTYYSNPNLTDTDGDGWDDGFEVSTGFSPTSAASSPDALSSIRVAAEYRFHAALGVNYRIEASTDLENWTTIETPIIGTGGVITRFYSVDGQAKRFYRSRRN